MKHDFRPIYPDQSVIYEIRIQGWIDERWKNWLEGLELSSEEDATVLTIPVTDQAALRGIMNKIWDLNLTLISAIRLQGFDQKERNQNE